MKGKFWTKPETLLRHQMAIGIFTDWDEKTLGFVKVDLTGQDAEC